VKSDTLRHRLIRGKEQGRIMGKDLEKAELRGEVRYIQTQNDTRKEQARLMGKYL
jgi:hypothetical protein